MKSVFAVFSVVLLFSCSKDADPNTDCTERLISMTWPGEPAGTKTVYSYNADNTLAKAIFWFDSLTIARADTFYYSGGQLMKSAYSLNGINFATPYAYTEWYYSSGKLSNSKYYIKQGTAYPLYANCSYVLNDSGQITQITQTQSANVQKNRFEYDADMNLRKVYIQFNSGPETLYDEYFDYDSLANPFYGQPFEFDYDMYLYGIDRFSKHNYRRHIRGSNDETYLLTYYSGGKLRSITQSSNPFPALTERVFNWQCQ